MGGLLLYENNNSYETMKNTALEVARENYKKDIIYMKWVAGYGGIYAPVTNIIPPNSHLIDIPERDIATPSGEKLTLINHSYLTKEVFEFQDSIYGSQAHISSTNFMNNQNTPDNWDKKAHFSFKKGNREYYTFDTIENKDYLKYMGVLFMEKNCLKCHTSNGYKAADICGGISISINMEPYNKIYVNERFYHVFIYGIIWIIGVIGLWFGMNRINSNFKNRLIIEEELRKSEAKYKELFLIKNSILECPEGMIVFALDKNYCYLDFNLLHKKTMKEIWRSDIEIGTNMLSIMKNESDRKNAKMNFDKALAGEGFILIEEYGDELFKRTFYENKYSPIYDGNNNIIGLVVFVIDITIRRHAEEALKESEEYFRAIFENNSSAIVVIEPDSTISKINEELYNLSYYTPEDLLGKSWTKIIHPDDLNQMLEYNRKRMLNPKDAPNKYECRMISKNGDVKNMLLSIAMLSNKKLIVSLIDISERKKAEEALKGYNSRLELAMDAAKMAWWDMDIKTGNIIYAKRKADMLGYDVNQFKHYIDFMKLVHPDDYDNTMDAMRNHFKGLAERYETEYRILASSGDYKWFYDIGSIVKRDSKGNPLKIIGLVIDITERKLDEEEQKKLFKQLRESNELIEINLFQKNALIEELFLAKENLEKMNSEKDKFFSIIAHDLKSPFSGFLGLTKMMAEETTEFTYEELQEISSNMQSSANNLYELLENLLEWARMQRGLIEFKPENFMLNDIVTRNISLVHEFAKQKNIVLINNISEEIRVTADIPIINTVLRNLISNALKFTTRGGKVEIGVLVNPSEGFKPSEGNIEIYVKDTGIGMSADTISKLFKIDQNVSRPGTEKESSTGLGLILCKEFIEKNGGSIWVESEVGKGSTFYFSLKIINS
jgi:PAS domain S-box-containing protein